MLWLFEESKQVGMQVGALLSLVYSVIHSGIGSHFDNLDTYVGKVGGYYGTLALQSTLPRSTNAENARSSSQ